jgi:hypothetical protein
MEKICEFKFNRTSHYNEIFEYYEGDDSVLLHKDFNNEVVTIERYRNKNTIPKLVSSSGLKMPTDKLISYRFDIDYIGAKTFKICKRNIEDEIRRVDGMLGDKQISIEIPNYDCVLSGNLYDEYRSKDDKFIAAIYKTSQNYKFRECLMMVNDKAHLFTLDDNGDINDTVCDVTKSSRLIDYDNLIILGSGDVKYKRNKFGIVDTVENDKYFVEKYVSKGKLDHEDTMESTSIYRVPFVRLSDGVAMPKYGYSFMVTETADINLEKNKIESYTKKVEYLTSRHYEDTINMINNR